MEIKIRLNDHKYRYDVYQMFNIYFALDELKFVDDGEYIINIEENKITFAFNGYYKESLIGENIKEEDVKANFKNGTLSIEIPKVEAKEVKSKKYIEIGE